MAARIDADVVRQAATGRWPEILQQVAGIPAEFLDSSQEHPCPKCGGETRFRLVDEAMGAVRCSHCFSTKCGDGFSAVGWMLDVAFPVALNKVGEHLGIKGAGEKDPGRELKWMDWSSDIAAFYTGTKVGTTEKGLLLAGARMARYKKDYTVLAFPIVGPDLNPAAPIGWVVCNFNGNTLPKYNRTGDVIGQVKTKITYGSQPGLVGSHAVERLKVPGLVELVWKVEGLTDLIALQGLIPEHLRERHVVVTNANGAKETPRWPAGVLATVNCNVIHDADQPGLAGGKAWATSISNQAAESIKVRFVELPYEVSEHHGKDLRDWINDGHTYADLLSMAEATALVKPPRTETGEIDHSKAEFPLFDLIMKKLQLEVLYEEESGAIRVFSTLPATRKSSTIRDVSRMKKETLMQICGASAKMLLSLEPDNENTFAISDVREAIALAASGRRSTSDERGCGVWQGLDAQGVESETVVLVGRNEGCRWNGDKILKKIISPRADGLMIDFGTCDHEWYDFDTLTRYLAEAEDVEWRRNVIDQTVDLFSMWRWRYQDIDPQLITGLVMATWIQTILRWRPLVSIGGMTNTGKSILFDTLGGFDNGRPGIFGKLAFKSSKSTTAGILQRIGNTAIAVFNDEFEAGRERSKALEAFRQASRGAQTAKGTAHHGGVKFKLQHIIWVAATETGLEKAPDANRYVQFELLPAPPEMQGKLRPPEAILQDLGQKLLAISMRVAIQARRMAFEIKDTHVDGIDPRMIESYSVPATMLALAGGYDEVWAREKLEELTGNIDKADQGRVDHDQLLVDILAAPVLAAGKTMTVAQILESDANRLSYSERLEATGVKMVPDSTGKDEGLFVVPRVVAEQLLRGKTWEGQKLDQILLRLRGARRSSRRLGGVVQRGVLLPASLIHNHQIAEDAGF
jgi:hypothetical protein